MTMFTFPSFLVGLCLILSVLGCRTIVLRPDPVIPAIQANYPSVEFQACNKVWNGLGICSVNRGDPLDDVKFKIQGYYRGTIQVVSDLCGINDLFRYEGSETISYFLNGKLDKSCLISFIVSPEYPDQQKGSVVVHSFKGHLFIRAKEEDEIWRGQAEKIFNGFRGFIKIKAKSELKSRVVLTGCGSNYDKEINPVDGYFQIRYSDILPMVETQSCIIQGLIDDGIEEEFITLMVWIYNDNFEALPVPIVKQTRRRLIVTTENYVSFISLDEKWKNDYEAKFWFDKDENHILRIITVKGRLLLGQWSNNKWVWKK